LTLELQKKQQECLQLQDRIKILEQEKSLLAIKMGEANATVDNFKNQIVGMRNQIIILEQQRPEQSFDNNGNHQQSMEIDHPFPQVNQVFENRKSVTER
jgi:predicted nuclease with TOPRIM domain